MRAGRSFRGQSLKVKLVALSLAALLPGFLVIGYTQLQITASRRAEVRELAVRSAAQAAAEIDRILSGVEYLLTAVSRAPVIRRMDEADCSAYLAELQPALPHLTAVTVLDAEGTFRCGSTPPPADRNFSQRPYFPAALASPEMVLGEYTIGRISGRAVLPVAFAMRDKSGSGLGVVVASIDLTWLGQQLKERGLPFEGSITVADRSGTIIARQPLPERFVGTKIPAEYSRLLQALTPGVEEIISQDGAKRVLGYRPLGASPAGLYVSAGLSSEASYGAVTRAAWTGTLLVALAGIATLGVTWLAGERLFVRPIQRITRTLQQWRGGAADVRTGMESESGELSALSAELDRMMDEIAVNQDQRDLLAGELIHRVKNTLATVMAIASATMNKAQPAKDVLPDFLARIAALDRTHEVLTSKGWDAAELRQIIRAVVRPLVADDERRVTCSGASVHLSAHQALGMTMVAHELCTNALKYGALSTVGGRVDVSWRMNSVDELEVVWRENGGPPVDPPQGCAGFGTRLLARAFGDSGTATVSFEPSGVVGRISLRLELPLDRGPAEDS